MCAFSALGQRAAKRSSATIVSLLMAETIMTRRDRPIAQRMQRLAATIPDPETVRAELRRVGWSRPFCADCSVWPWPRNRRREMPRLATPILLRSCKAAARTTGGASRRPADPYTLPDLSRILPPVVWLTPAHCRQWRERTAVYLTAGMSRPEAEQEAMAELICTGKFYDRDEGFPWPN